MSVKVKDLVACVSRIMGQIDDLKEMVRDVDCCKLEDIDFGRVYCAYQILDRDYKHLFRCWKEKIEDRLIAEDQTDDPQQNGWVGSDGRP